MNSHSSTAAAAASYAARASAASRVRSATSRSTVRDRRTIDMNSAHAAAAASSSTIVARASTGRRSVRVAGGTATDTSQRLPERADGRGRRILGQATAVEEHRPAAVRSDGDDLGRARQVDQRTGREDVGLEHAGHHAARSRRPEHRHDQEHAAVARWAGVRRHELRAGRRERPVEGHPRGSRLGQVETAVIRSGPGAGGVRDRIAIARGVSRDPRPDTGRGRERRQLSGRDPRCPQHGPEPGNGDHRRRLPPERIGVDPDRRRRHAGAVDDRLGRDRAGQHRQPQARLAEGAHGVGTRPRRGVRAVVGADLTGLPAGDTGDDAGGKDTGHANGDGRSGHTDHGPSSAAEV